VRETVRRVSTVRGERVELGRVELRQPDEGGGAAPAGTPGCLLRRAALRREKFGLYIRVRPQTAAPLMWWL